MPDGSIDPSTLSPLSYTNHHGGGRVVDSGSADVVGVRPMFLLVRLQKQSCARLMHPFLRDINVELTLTWRTSTALESKQEV